VLIDNQPIEAPLNRNLGSPVAPGQAVEAKLDRLITRRHDARVSFARTLGVEQSELISRIGHFGHLLKKRKAA
jgi:hypothetical protein